VNDQRCALLIVEDDEKLQDLIRTILSRQATSIDVASDGEEAIEKLPAGTLVLQKPFEIDKLAETVRGICAELRTSSAG
jgi:hypothetical protein